jgi:hypothetical protein
MGELSFNATLPTVSVYSMKFPLDREIDVLLLGMALIKRTDYGTT